ncbi:MAG TPA: twin-arginine translocation signal domain-containing protein [Corynebacteriales bacterium]|nr:twin-arginine translocation signal domain-containing protein [Mycobacteriales bacterium]
MTSSFSRRTFLQGAAAVAATGAVLAHQTPTAQARPSPELPPNLSAISPPVNGRWAAVLPI